MSTQTESTQEVRGRNGQQITPVIIKSGGGGSEPTDIEVLFDMLGKPFESPPGNDTWTHARSASPARIVSLTVIEDGKTVLGPVTANELAVLQVSFGEDSLIVQDVALDHLQNTIVSITSPISFTVTKPSDSAGQWLESDAPFPSEAPLVRFTQGQHLLAEYQCQSFNFTFEINLDWD